MILTWYFLDIPALTQKSDPEGKPGHKGNSSGHWDAAAQQDYLQDYILG